MCKLYQQGKVYNLETSIKMCAYYPAQTEEQIQEEEGHTPSWEMYRSQKGNFFKVCYEREKDEIGEESIEMYCFVLENEEAREHYDTANCWIPKNTGHEGTDEVRAEYFRYDEV